MEIVGDQVRMYYSSGRPEHRHDKMGMASWLRHGFVSVHAGPHGVA